MPGRQAKTLAPSALKAALRYVHRHSDPVRSRTIILLSVRAGLRAAEIAKLQWPMVLNANGQVAETMDVRNCIAKKGSGRRIPIHKDLHHELAILLRRGNCQGPIIRSKHGGAMRANSIVNWFIVLYRELGLEGCSSHSGRRTFITQAARLAHRAHGSLRDVQILAGHRDLTTTQHYIDGDSDAQRRLIALL